MALIKLDFDYDSWKKITHTENLASFNGFPDEFIDWCEETGTKIKVGIRCRFERCFESTAMKANKPLQAYRDILEFRGKKFDDSIEWIRIDFWFESGDAITLFKLAWF